MVEQPENWDYVSVTTTLPQGLIIVDAFMRESVPKTDVWLCMFEKSSIYSEDY